ncbi:hypothetical protein CWN98_07500 [Vibrio splendidus]|uniref:hypothetical protein n=1 Tax=Vibrio splendidus TaxID=29497 RepID=UPI000C863158|nr:hypothetical protein [Vibrio splendidus]PMG19226.1 hypothetical protein BCU95_01395 [Vibrio splendidus]PTO88339.1 hypothetical protein CWN98_07500 [Vibrio splendidus]PTP48853.1 hypothetical protein CWO10_06470 [Vibrio splendidus]
MKIVQYLAHDLLESDYGSRMTESVSQGFYSYVHSHTNFLEKADPVSAKKELNYVLTVEDDSGNILGFRYFYWEKSMSRIHFFAVVMDESIKRQGYAINTLLKGVAIGNKLGINRFYFTINSKSSPERDGLVASYKRICTELFSQGNQFEVMYLDKGFVLK